MRRIAWVALLVLVSGQVRPTVLDKGDTVRVGDTRAFIREQIMAAKTTIWTGATDTDWTTAGNWTNGQPSTTGDKDFVIISKAATNDILLNVDRTVDNGGAGLDVALLEIEEGCSIDIGSSANYLQLTGDKVSILGGGDVYLRGNDGTSGLDIDKLIVDAPGTYVHLKLNDGPIESHFLSGTIDVNELTSATSAALVMFQGISQRHGSTSTVSLAVSASKDITIYYINGGELKTTAAYLNGGITRLTNGGGKVVWDGAASVAVMVQTGGLTEITAATFSTLVEAWLMGGTLDTRNGWRNDDAAVAINIFPGATWNRTPFQAGQITPNIVGE